MDIPVSDIIEDDYVEGPRLEFKDKRADPETITKELVAFANAEGGTLILGIRESGGDIQEIQDIDNTSKLEETMQSIIDSRVEPSIQIRHEVANYDEKTLLLFHVEDSATIHSIEINGRPVFPNRQGSTTSYLHSYEVRERLTGATPQADRDVRSEPFGTRSISEVREIVDDRLRIISNREEQAASLISGPTVVLEVIPEKKPPTASPLDIHNVSEPRIFWNTLRIRPEIGGKELLSTRGYGAGENYSYTLITIDGLYEAVSTRGFFQQNNELKLQCDVHRGGPGFDGAVILGVRDAIDRLSELGFDGNVVVFISLLDAKDVSIPTERGAFYSPTGMNTENYTTEPVHLNMDNPDCIGELEPIISEIHREIGDIDGTDNIENGEWVGAEIVLNGERIL